MQNFSRLVFSTDPARFRQDLVNIARTTLSSKVLSQDKDYFANLAVDAVLRLKVSSLPLSRMILTLTYGQGSTNLEHIQIIKKVGGKLTDSYLDEGAHLSPQDIFRSLKSRVGFILDKTIGTNCPKRLENAKILIANTCKPNSPMFCYSFSSIHTSHGHRQNQGFRCSD